jgi:hypothetical protein
MLKYLAFSITTVSLLAGCSSTPATTVAQEPYCYTNETVDIENNATVNSSTRLECSDDPLKRAKLVGVDPKNCRPWQRQDIVNGRVKTYGGYICRDEKNNWRPLTSF